MECLGVWGAYVDGVFVGLGDHGDGRIWAFAITGCWDFQGISAIGLLECQENRVYWSLWLLGVENLTF